MMVAGGSETGVILRTEVGAETGTEAGAEDGAVDGLAVVAGVGSINDAAADEETEALLGDSLPAAELPHNSSYCARMKTAS